MKSTFGFNHVLLSLLLPLIATGCESYAEYDQHPFTGVVVNQMKELQSSISGKFCYKVEYTGDGDIPASQVSCSDVKTDEFGLFTASVSVFNAFSEASGKAVDATDIHAYFQVDDAKFNGYRVEDGKTTFREALLYKGLQYNFTISP